MAPAQPSTRTPARPHAKKARKANRVFFWIALVVVLPAGSFAAYRLYRSKTDAPIHYESVAVDLGRVAAKVTATGTLSALVTVQVGSQVSGRIDSLKADFNSTVTKGQVIATLDPALFQAAVQQAQANLTAARANVEQAKAQALDADRQFERAKALLQQQLMSKSEYDTAEATAAAARARVASVEASVQQSAASANQASINLRYATVVSPIDGVVISRSVDVGQTVAASLQAPVLFTIAQDLTKMQVDTSVAEGDVGKIKPEMHVAFTVDAYPQRKFHGKVRQVRDSATTVQNVVTYDAVIDVDNPERLLKPGMTATVTFTYAEREGVTRIPNAAFRYRPDPRIVGSAATAASTASARSAGARSGVALGAAASASGAPGDERAGGGSRGRRGSGAGSGGEERASTRTVWVLRNGKPDPVVVTTGITDGSMTEVREGEIHPGDQVITESTGGPAPTSTAGSAPFPRRL